MSRRGLTLVELVVALGVLALVLTGATKMLLIQKRFYHELGQRTDVSDNLRAGVDILTADLWGLDARDGDILAMGPDSLVIRAERTFGVVCGVAPLALRSSLQAGVRDFRSGDSVLAYSVADSMWEPGLITSGPAAAVCPDSAPAERIGVAGSTPLEVGAPVRGFEIVTYRSYRASDGAYYLGVRDAGGLQPLVGPLAPGGLLFTFRDSSGAPAADSRSVDGIRLRLRALSAEPVVRRGVTAVLDDSVVSWVTLRNNPHR